MNSSSTHRIPMRGRQRRGAALILALVLMVLVGLVAGSIVSMGAARRRQAATRERAAQAEALAEAGLSRAIARLAVSDDYDGEVWEISAEDLGGPDAATVAIRVQPADGPGTGTGTGTGRVVEAIAEYPKGAEDAARRSRQRQTKATDAGRPSAPAPGDDR